MYEDIEYNLTIQGHQEEEEEDLLSLVSLKVSPYVFVSSLNFLRV